MSDHVGVPQLRQQSGLPQEGGRQAIVPASVGQLQVYHAQQHRLSGAEAFALEDASLGPSFDDLLQDYKLIHQPQVGPRQGPELLALGHLPPLFAHRRHLRHDVGGAHASEDLQQNKVEVGVIFASWRLPPLFLCHLLRRLFRMALLSALRGRERHAVEVQALQRSPVANGRLPTSIWIHVLAVFEVERRHLRKGHHLSVQAD
mmetsp:Transcript_58954/g.140470  ORF Transcript_58954/g.140470 Transcript_58954/m.140470 type:complete len:203 (-) Transcript_58954:16-624(-)